MVVLIFTCMGGFQSVARTDTANAVLILIGVIAGAATVLHLTGGWGAITANFAATTAPTIVGGDPLPAGALGSTWGIFGASTIISFFLSNCVGSIVAPHWISGGRNHGLYVPAIDYELLKPGAGRAGSDSHLRGGSLNGKLHAAALLHFPDL